MTTEATTTPAATPQAATPAADYATLEQRVAAVHDELRTEAPPEPAAESGEAPTDSPAEATPAPAADSGSAPNERQQRLAALRDKERERAERRARQEAETQARRELAEAQKRAEEAEARAGKLVDLDGMDEAAFFRLAQSKGIKPERLGEWIRDAMTNPEKIAEAAAQDAARKAVDPKLSAVEKELAELKAQLAEERSFRAQAQQRAEEQRVQDEFMSFANTNLPQAPFASKFLAKRGREAFIALADQAATLVPPGSGFQAVLDVIETSLADLAEPFVDQPQTAATPPKQRAAAKASTVSNAIAGERASVVDEDDWSSLPFEERVSRMKASR